MYLQNMFQQNENPRANVDVTYQNQLESCNVIIFSYGYVIFSLGEKVFFPHSYKKYRNSCSLNFYC